ncbi:hypothetical protein L7F22_019991 [Adiantum nelumboides]|nr:hypothetical protein [Adiantum nelumboides]
MLIYRHTPWSPTGQFRWNLLDQRLVSSIATIAAEFLLPDGMLVFVCRGELVWAIVADALDHGFIMVRSLYVRVPEKLYVSTLAGVHVVRTLTMLVFQRKDAPPHAPVFSMAHGEIVADSEGFEADDDLLNDEWGILANEDIPWTKDEHGRPFREAVKKSSKFASWLIGTFTKFGDLIIDCLVGTRGVAKMSKEYNRHCISIDSDPMVSVSEFKSGLQIKMESFGELNLQLI